MSAPNSERPTHAGPDTPGGRLPTNVSALTFLPLGEAPRGTMTALLRDAYAFDPSYEAACLATWREHDDFFSDRPELASRCGFVTMLRGEAVGFIVYDPRTLPDYVELGDNCIAARCKGRGYGHAQLAEAVGRLTEAGARELRVWTDENLIPAQRNYESVGFRAVRRWLGDDGRWHIDYRLRVARD